MIATRSHYVWPGQTHFGVGVAALAGEQARALHTTRAFVLADPGVVAAGLLEQILPALAAARIEYQVYDQIVPNPDVPSVDAAGAACRASGADVIIGIGGGSALDTAKAVRLLAVTPPEISITAYSYLLNAQPRPLPDVRTLPPMIAIPTTAGTGAEATPWGVITEPATKRKFGFGDTPTIPTVALLDPALTLGLPPFLTAATGMDALTHLIEAYVSTNNHQPALDPQIRYGMELVGRNLRTAVSQGDNPQARSEMLLASYLGGVAISANWLGACHALAHPLSGIANVPHGLANAMMLPHQMRFSLPAALERYAQIAVALDPAAAGLGSVEQQAQAAVAAVEALLVDVGLPTRLRDAGVRKEQIPALSTQAIGDANWRTNPRPVTQGDLEALYHQAF
jgi:4-hydroxybutyrate dehydrogenase